MTSHTRMTLLLLAAVFLAAIVPPARAQQEAAATMSVEDSIQILRTLIERRTAQRDRLGRMLSALDQVDSAYKPLYPAWLIVDNDLRQRVNKTFRLHRPSASGDSDVVVLANTGRTEILDLSLGTAHIGRIESRQILSDTLYNEILRGDYQQTRVDLTLEPARTADLDIDPRYGSLTASAFAVRLLFHGGYGIESVIGRDEIGYPFWSSGDFSVRAVLNRLKLGILLPFPYGYRTERVIDPLAIKPALLVGSTGFSGEFEQPFGDTKAGIRLTVGELYVGSLARKVPDSTSAYSLHTTAQVYVSRQLRWGDDVFDLTGGIGFHQITQSMSDSKNNTVVTLDKQDFVSPLLRVDYTSIGNRLYGVGIQYYNSALLFTGWVEVVKHFLFVDLKYFTPAFREPQPWEQKYFFMISPRLVISY